MRVGELKDKKYLTEMFLKDKPNFKEIMDLKKLGTACKNIQKSIVDETIEHNLEIFNKDVEKDKLIVANTHEDTTLSGLIAFYLTLKYEKPCLVVHDDNIDFKGSGRAINGIENLKTSETDDFLKFGEIEPCTAEEFAKKIKSALGGMVSFTDAGKTIKTVALCSGGGGDLVAAVKNIGADAFLTGEAKHHEYLYSNDFGISMFVAGHFETENIVCEYLYNSLNEKFGSEIEIKVSDLKNPVKYI